MLSVTGFSSGVLVFVSLFLQDDNPEMIIKAAESAGYESTHYYSRENGVTYKVDL